MPLNLGSSAALFEGERRESGVVFPLSAPRLDRDTQRSLALLQLSDVVSRSREPAEALLESEQLLTAYFSAAKVGFCILDTDLRYLAINRTLAEMNVFPQKRT